MAHDLFKDLAWLPPPPPDFGAQCRAVLASTDDTLAQSLRKLASYALDENDLQRLATVARKLHSDHRSLAPLRPFKLGLLGNGTQNLIAPALVASALRFGIALECVTSDYDQVIQAAVDPQSPINQATPDAVLIAVDYRGLPLQIAPGDEAAGRLGCDAALDYLSAVRNGLRNNGNAVCIFQTLAPPVDNLFGNFDRRMAGTIRQVIDTFNRSLVDWLQGSDDLLLDVASLAEIVGTANWHSPAQWNLARLPFASECVPLYADHVGRLVGALRGTSRRCLILDLDNTVWGGVIGDDGLDGIKIARGDAVGEAYLSVQSAALALRGRGVLLAVSSKNADEIARKPFRMHPEMLLREDHIAVFQANWEDKASNIRAIADELVLGLDAMVFLDDNPAERGLIRHLLPEVAVPELPADPALYARTLAAAGYFEAITYSEEDRIRAAFHQDNARRVTLKNKVSDLQAYLESLQMEIAFQPFDRAGRERITQLINKSNQFNLTTRRYTESAVGDAERDPDVFTLQVRLKDVFGDNGMISVVICRPRGRNMWQIDTWLMSCRVLGRQVERMVLREIVHHARARGIEQIVGVYVPTGRNGLVSDHYAKLGFTLAETFPDGAVEWLLDTAQTVEAASMAAKRSGFAAEMA